MPRQKRGVGGELIGRVGGQVSILAQQVEGYRARIQDHSTMDGSELVQAKLERGDDAKVAAATANGPEEIFILRGANRQVIAIGVHEVGGDDIVATEAVLTHEPADTAAERKPADAGGRDDAAGSGKRKLFAFAIECSPGGAALGECGLPAGFDLDLSHKGEVNHHGAVGDGLSGDAMAAAADRGGEAVFASKTNGLNHIGDAGGAHDDGWLAVNHAVPDMARSDVVRIIRGEDGAAEDSAQPGKLVS